MCDDSIAQLGQYVTSSGSRDESGRRGHTHKFCKTRVRLDIAKFSFGDRKHEVWCELTVAEKQRPEKQQPEKQ